MDQSRRHSGQQVIVPPAHESADAAHVGFSVE